MTKQEEIKVRCVDEFYEKYSPECAKKYPITMRVSEEEESYVKWRRREWQLNRKR